MPAGHIDLANDEQSSGNLDMVKTVLCTQIIPTMKYLIHLYGLMHTPRGTWSYEVFSLTTGTLTQKWCVYLVNNHGAVITLSSNW